MIKLSREDREWFYILVQKAGSKSSDFHTCMETLKSLLDNKVTINSYSDRILCELPTIRYDSYIKTYNVAYHRNSVIEPKYQMLIASIIILAHDRDKRGNILEEYSSCCDVHDLIANNPELFCFWPPNV